MRVGRPGGCCNNPGENMRSWTQLTAAGRSITEFEYILKIELRGCVERLDMKFKQREKSNMNEGETVIMQ